MKSNQNKQTNSLAAKNQNPIPETKVTRKNPQNIKIEKDTRQQIKGLLKKFKKFIPSSYFHVYDKNLKHIYNFLWETKPSNISLNSPENLNVKPAAPEHDNSIDPSNISLNSPESLNVKPAAPELDNSIDSSDPSNISLNSPENLNVKPAAPEHDNSIDPSDSTEKYCNTMHDVFTLPIKNRRPRKSLKFNEQQAEIINEKVKRMVLCNSKTSSFTERLRKSYKIKVDELKQSKKHLLFGLDEYVDVARTIEQCLLQSISYNVNIIAYKFERTLGMMLLQQFLYSLAPEPVKSKKPLYLSTTLKDFPKERIPKLILMSNQMTEWLALDLKNEDCIRYLYELVILEKKNVNLLKSFKSLSTGITDENWTAVSIVMGLSDNFKSYILPTTKKIQEFQNIIQVLKGIKAILASEQPDSEFNADSDITLARKIRTRLTNIRNVFVKQLGMESTEFLLEKNILERRSLGNINTYVLKPKLTYVNLSHRLPELYLSKTNPEHQLITTYLKNDNTLASQFWHNEITNDHILGEVHDKDSWHDAQGSLSLNLNFATNFLQNMLYVMQRVKSNKSEKLNKEAIIFLNNYFDFNVDYFKLAQDKDKLFKEILRYAFDFTDLTKRKFYHKKIISPIMVMGINKIYQRKFFFLQLLTDLPIMLSFDNWKILFKFCARGRGYASPSLFTYTLPIIKHFMGFSEEYRAKDEKTLANFQDTTKFEGTDRHKSPINYQLKRLLPDGSSILDYVNTIEQHGKKMKLSHVLTKKKPYEMFVLLKDYMLIRHTDYKFQYYYTLDACGSGIQINGLLLKSKKIALACGLIKSDKPDFYTQFVNYVQKELTARAPLNTKVPQALLEKCTEFENTYLTTSYSTTALLTLLKNKNAVSDLMTLTQEMNMGITKKDALLFIGKYRSKISTKAIVKALLAVKALPPTLRKKKYMDIADILVDVKPLSIRVKLAFLFAVFKLIRLERHIQEINEFIPMVDRKMVKHPIMTYFYGSGILTRCQAYEDAFIMQCVDKKIPLTKAIILSFRRFTTYIDHMLREWVRNTLPEARLLYKLFYYLGKDENYEPPKLSNSHVTWKYEPHKSVSYTKSIHNKDFRLQKYTDALDSKKISSGFLANYIQSKDSVICSDIVQYLKAKNIPVLTIHDCWKVPYQHAAELETAILHAYTKFSNENHLKKDFSETVVWHSYLYMKDMESSFDFTEYDVKDFNIETIAKP